MLPGAAEEASGRQYALKRMRKAAVVQCPEHVFCEQAITRNTAHPFCIRQYASFQARRLPAGPASQRLSLWLSFAMQSTTVSLLCAPRMLCVVRCQH